MAPHRRLTVFKEIMRRQAMQDDMYELSLAKSKKLDPMDFKRAGHTRSSSCTSTQERGTRRSASRRSATWTPGSGRSTSSTSRERPHTAFPAGSPYRRRCVRSSPTGSCYARSGWRTILWIHQRPSLKEPDDGFLYDIILRAIKHVVEEDLGIKFDLRQCRRTFGQRYLDKDLDIESVSVLMGHASTKTTEGFYSRKRLDRAIENAIGTWNDNGGQ